MKANNQNEHLKERACLLLTIAGILLVMLAIFSLLVGRYPLSIKTLKSGDPQAWRVFWLLRFPRVVMGVVGGFCLGLSGFVFQTIFRNPLASPDIIGASSGASCGAAFGILFLPGIWTVNLCAFIGALITVLLALLLSSLDKSGKNSTIVLAGIAVHALAQTALMSLKLAADPEKELASIEYWIMGSLSGINVKALGTSVIIILVTSVLLFVLHRQILLLSVDENEATLLGVPVGTMRLITLLIATLSVATTICLTGLISFVGLLAPHIARMLTKNNRVSTMALSGLIGSVLLVLADILARSVGSHELPVSIFTSLLGAPFLILLLFKSARKEE